MGFPPKISAMKHNFFGMGKMQNNYYNNNNLVKAYRVIKLYIELTEHNLKYKLRPSTLAKVVSLCRVKPKV